jgi:hypothetical protein
MNQLSDALHILDLYRLAIMFRPPAMLWRSFPRADVGIAGNLDRTGPHCSAVDLSNAHLAESDTLRSMHPLASLGSLSPYVWPVLYPRQNQYNGDDIHIESLLLAKADFAGLKCSEWYQQQQAIEDAVDPLHLVSYHTINILMHANMTTLQTYAHSSLGSQTRDPAKSAVAKEMQDWTSSQHFKVAHWYAEQILAAVEKTYRAVTRNRSISRATDVPMADSRSFSYEAPHVPYAIYFAALIVWSGLALDPNTAGGGQTQAPIVRAEKLLRGHKMHVAQLLATVLNDIK